MLYVLSPPLLTLIQAYLIQTMQCANVVPFMGCRNVSNFQSDFHYFTRVLVLHLWFLMGFQLNNILQNTVTLFQKEFITKKKNAFWQNKTSESLKHKNGQLNTLKLVSISLLSLFTLSVLTNLYNHRYHNHHIKNIKK